MRIRVLLAAYFAIHALGYLALPDIARADENNIVISEIMPGYSGHAGDEFIELYNVSDDEVALDGWSVQYKAATASANAACTTGWQVKARLGDDAVIPAHGFYLLGAGAYAAAADVAVTSFAFGDTAGQVRIVDGDGVAVDGVSWGSGGACGEGSPAPAPAGGQSLERLPGAYLEDGGNAVDSGDNASDLMRRAAPQPQGSGAEPEAPAVVTAADITYAGVVISEVMPAAASGQTPYVELFNPGVTAAYVGGFELVAGNARYELPPLNLEPGAHAAIAVKATVLPLTTNGFLRLVSPTGDELDVTAPWEGAVAGHAWMLADDGWSWTITPTPGAANHLVEPVAGTPGKGAADQAGVFDGELKLSELLPDPASPLSDASDEFIELYNPSAEAVDLTGFILKTGASLGSSYVFKDGVIEAGAYLEVTSAQTKIGLSNSGSRVALFDPAGNLVDETSYGAAKTGATWTRQPDGSWAWSTTATPGAANIVSASAITAAAAKTTAANVKKAASAKASTKKAATPKPTKKPKATKTPKAKQAAVKTPALVAASSTSGGLWLLFGLVALTIGYIMYEFRHDVAGLFNRAKAAAASKGLPGYGLAKRRDDNSDR